MDPRQIRRRLRNLDRAIDTAAGLDRASLRAELAALEQDVTEAMESLQLDARLGRLSLDLARLFAASSAPREFSRVALEAICAALNASTAWVLAFDEDEEEARVLACREESGHNREAGGLSRSILNHLIQTRKTVLERDAQRSRDASSIMASGIRSVLATPLILEGRVGGAIYLENRTLASVFGESDKALLESVARLLAPYLQAGRRLESAIDERERLAAALEGETSYKDFVGRSPAVKKVLATIELLKDSDAPILVRGESGTGKELVARALHHSGRRAAGPFVTVNCAAIPEGLLESELFGHERGAFTGATEKRKGKFELAHGGTLFLDEVGDMRLDLQAKLLRVLQDQCFQRVGGSDTIQVDVRLVAATNKDLRELAAAALFREELFYRLEVVPIEVPPLRERSEDIPLLVEHFLASFRQQTGKAIRFDQEVMGVLERYAFPGNVRELRNLVYRLVALAQAELVTAAELPEHVSGERPLSLEKDPLRRFLRHTPETADELKVRRKEMRSILESYERKLEADFLHTALERTGGNITEAARLTGMNRSVFHRRLAALNGKG